MKKIMSVLCMLILLFSDVAVAEAVNVSAKSAIVIDAYSKRVLFEKNAYEKRGMASTTKIMTGLIAIERLAFDDIVSVSSFAANTEGSSIWLSPGEHMSVEDLLYGLMLASGNDAATALAEHTAGSVDAFTVIMNHKACEMGAMNTNFTNPHGLPDENHYTTAYDLALISANAMENSVFSEIVKTKNKAISWEGSQYKRSLSNHNKLLKMSDCFIGIKTGYTKKDGRCLVSCSEKDGQKLIIVTLSASDDWNDHISLSRHCFTEYYSYTVCAKGENVGVFVSEEIDADPIEITFNSTYTMSISDGEERKIKRVFNFNPLYPVKEGDIVGSCDIYIDENLIKTVDLTANNDAQIQMHFISVIKRLMKGIIKQ